MVFQLVYVSRETHPLTAEELDALLADARTNNGRLNITGMLLYQEGSFIQVLEGEREAVERLFDHIAKDPRHERIQTVLRSEVAERAFVEWSMGYKRVQSREDVPEGFHHFLERGYRRNSEHDEAAARRALLAFREGRWRV